MALNTQEERRRQREIHATQRQRRTQPQRSELVNAAQGLMRVVLRSVTIDDVDPPNSSMFFHRLRYSTSPPVVGQYETFGDLERGYPLECAEYKDYEVWVWPETVPGEGGQVPNPVSILTVPLLAIRSRADWILMVPLKGDGSLLPADEPVNECSFG